MLLNSIIQKVVDVWIELNWSTEHNRCSYTVWLMNSKVMNEIEIILRNLLTEPMYKYERWTRFRSTLKTLHT